MKAKGRNRKRVQRSGQWMNKIGLMFVAVMYLFVMTVFITSTGRLPNLDLVLLTLLLSTEIKWRLLYLLDMD